MAGIERLRAFVADAMRLVERHGEAEPALLDGMRPLMRDLVRHDDWLPDAYAQPDPVYYQQFLLYADPLDRFSLVSFVWGPGQVTPVHDHRVWGVLGVLRGAELGTEFAREADGSLRETGQERLDAGDVAAVSPSIGDIHAVANAYADRVSISIHAYGGNIGRIRRAVYDRATGAEKPFVSGYSNRLVPNLWPAPDRAAG